MLDELTAWRIPYESRPPDERLLAAAVFMADGDSDALAEGFGSDRRKFVNKGDDVMSP